MVDEANDRILTSLELLFQHGDLLGDLCGDVFEDYRADPLRILYKYLDYVVWYMIKEMQANSDRKEAFIRRRVEWINIVLAAMDLPEDSEFYKGWGKGWNERQALEGITTDASMSGPLFVDRIVQG
jgi:hypothetical protein